MNSCVSRISRRRCIGLLASVAPSTLLFPALAAAQTAEQGADQVGQVGMAEIIVTANRRAERGQDVPISITALSPQRLEQQGIAKEQDLAASVPSLVVGQNGQGSRDSQSFTIRGQGATFQASPGVVVYLGEVPLPAAITLSQQGGPGNFVDLENLQVLSGPQGTLFGRNTTGGAVLLVPKKPTNDFGGWIKGEYGNYDRNYIEGAVNLPIVNDKVLLRVAGAYHDRDGFTRDVTFNKDRDNEHWFSGRVGLTLKPTDALENYTMAYYSKSDNNGTGLVNKGFNINGLKLVGFCTDPGEVSSGIDVPCDVYRGVTARSDALGPRQTAFSTDVFQQTISWGISNTTDLELSDELKLRNILSYQKLRIRYRYDGDASVLQQHDVDPGVLPGPGVVTSPFPINYFNATLATELPRDDLRQFTEELQIQGDMMDSKLVWTVGGFYYEQKPDGPQGSRAVVYCPAAFTGFCGASYARYGTSTVSKAVYAQATLDLGLLTPALDKLKLTAGYRYTWDHISGFATQYSQQTANPTLATCGADNSTVSFATAAADCQFSASLRTKAPSWVVGLDYKVTPAILLYGKVSRGYKAGGFNQYAVFTNTRTFDPEHVTSYEIGMKSDFHLGSMPVRLNTALYTLDYKGIQRATGDLNPVTFAGGARTLNADARIRGVEVEASIRPFQGLEIGGNLSYTDAKYKKYQYTVNNAFGQEACNGFVPFLGTADSSCLKLQYLAPWIWSVHAAAEQPLGKDAGTLSLFVNYSHTSSQNTEAVQLPSSQPGAVLGAYGTLSASLDWRNVMGSAFDVGLFGTNLANKLYRTSNSDVYQNGGLLYWATIYGEPRMYGVRVKYHFGAE
ncbi:TonB-dependent receptor domain-containing protein [Sphingobium sp.]|uniref:TonB-dependent receptor domain-containing protein n=1 Tax=Sphingobium sp. TaxID=1912891 RepID=UPI0035C78598